MRNTYFASIKKALSASTTEVRSATVESKQNSSLQTTIQRLTTDEYSAVSGGPEVENEPQK